MKYSVQARLKYLSLMKEKISYYKENHFQLLKKGVSISKGNSKIGRCLNVSLPPIVACKNCKECGFYCYDIKANFLYPQVADARARNYVFATEYPEIYWSAIWETMSRRRRNFYFRFHVAGDILNMEYLEKMVETAKAFPHYIIWTYTKYYFIVNAYVRKHGGTREKAIPENLRIMFSEWDGMPMSNPFGFPVFSCKLANGNKNHPVSYFDGLFKCPGNCDLCKPTRENPCGLGCIAGMNTYADEH